jgi:succinyl-CoA synthetase beta subunit
VDLYEYQGKQYFVRFGIPTPAGVLCRTVDEARVGADELGYPVAVKAQVKVGGRGKAGGVQLARDAEEVQRHASNILGMNIKGHVVRCLWIQKDSGIAREYYASFTLDRAMRLHLCMVSSKGGVEIEQVAATDPDAIARLHVDPVEKLSVAQARKLVADAGLDEDARAQATDLLVKLYDCYTQGDCDLTEINPLVLTTDGRVLALDAKVTLDDNAAFRHPEWVEFADPKELDPREKLAKEKGLNYIGLSGSVGVIANGAGLAMSTLDVVTQVGGSAANFLDIGGGASAEVMASALEVINSDDAVRSILVNVFGGITRVDEVANGVVEAMRRVELRSPIVLRLDGTNAEKGHEILAGHLSGRVVVEDTMVGAARRAVVLAGGES